MQYMQMYTWYIEYIHIHAKPTDEALWTDSIEVVKLPALANDRSATLSDRDRPRCDLNASVMLWRCNHSVHWSVTQAYGAEKYRRDAGKIRTGYWQNTWKIQRDMTRYFDVSVFFKEMYTHYKQDTYMNIHTRAYACCHVCITYRHACMKYVFVCMCHYYVVCICNFACTLIRKIDRFIFYFVFMYPKIHKHTDILLQYVLQRKSACRWSCCTLTARQQCQDPAGKCVRARAALSPFRWMCTQSFFSATASYTRARASSLRDLLRNRTVALDAGSALRLLQGVARGMAFLHARSVEL